MAHLRKKSGPNASLKPFWKIGLYIRLSKEDSKESESDSVVNQEKILRDFVEGYFEPGTYAISDVFIDDGLTGTDIKRPQFQRLEGCIKRKDINCMILKSLARGFRNLGDQQKFLEEFLPAYGVRFINLSSPFIDTYDNPPSLTGLEIPIRGMFNEQFAAATSEEIRKTFRMKRARGEFIGAFAPYGYRKDPHDKNKLLIDEEAAQVVRSVFQWFVYEGFSKKAIAQKLNNIGIPNPTVYKQKKGFNYQNPHSGVNDGLWAPNTIAKMLKNPQYIGVMVQGRHRVISYKVHKMISVPEDEWFIVPGTHEALIDSDTFDKAQTLHQRDMRTPPHKKELYLFSGFLRCAGCKKAMHRKTSGRYVYCVCRTFSDKKTCTKHTVRLDKLEQAVLIALQRQIELVETLADVVNRILDAPIVHQTSQQLVQSLKTLDKQLEKLNNMMDDLYIDWKNGDISREDYLRLKHKFEAQIHRLQQNIIYLKEEVQPADHGSGWEDPYLTSFLNNQNIQSLNRGILVTLIDTIWIHEKMEITIDFNFSDSDKDSSHLCKKTRP